MLTPQGFLRWGIDLGVYNAHEFKTEPSTLMRSTLCPNILIVATPPRIPARFRARMGKFDKRPDDRVRLMSTI